MLRRTAQHNNSSRAATTSVWDEGRPEWAGFTNQLLVSPGRYYICAARIRTYLVGLPSFLRSNRQPAGSEEQCCTLWANLPKLVALTFKATPTWRCTHLHQ